MDRLRTDKVKESQRRYRLANREKLRAINKAWQEANREKVQAYQKAYRVANRAEAKAYGQVWRQEHLEERKEKDRLYYLANREKALERQRLYGIKNRERISVKAKSEEGRARGRTAMARRRATPHGKILNRLRCRLSKLLRSKHIPKTDTTMALVGCSLDHLIGYLTSLFTHGMTLEALMDGKIHVDHIRPCASFNLADMDQQKLCFHYTNLQPMWAVDNLRKNAKWPL